MLCSLWRNNIGDQGAIALAAVFKETKITDLMCALTSNRLPIVFANVSAPVDTASPVLAVLLGTNSASKEEPLSLTGSRATRRCKCSSRLLGARTGPKCSPFCQRPLTRLISALLLAHSLENNQIRNKGASALAAILKETQITNLKCAAARVFAFVSMP